MPPPPESNPAGDIPDNQVYVPFTPAGDRFTISVPEAGRAAPRAPRPSSRTSTTPSGSRPATAPPRRPSSRSSPRSCPASRRGTPGYRAGTVTAVQRRAGQAVLITYQAASAPNPVTGKSVTEAVERYQFWHNGTEVVVTLSGPQGTDNVDPWRTITDSLQWP